MLSKNEIKVELKNYQKKKQIEGMHLKRACCLLRRSEVEGNKWAKSVDWREEGVVLFFAEGMVHPQTQRIQQASQDCRPLCHVLLLCIQTWPVPAVRGQNFNIKGLHGDGFERLHGGALQSLTADIVNSKKVEGVNVDAVGLASGDPATHQGR